MSCDSDVMIDKINKIMYPTENLDGGFSFFNSKKSDNSPSGGKLKSSKKSSPKSPKKSPKKSSPKSGMKTGFSSIKRAMESTVKSGLDVTAQLGTDAVTKKISATLKNPLLRSPSQDNDTKVIEFLNKIFNPEFNAKIAYLPEIKTDINNLKIDINGLKTDLASIKTNFVELKGEISSLKSILDDKNDKIFELLSDKLK